jgi:mRNA interferase RelE/StbE
LAFKIVYKSSVARDLKRIDPSEARRILDEIERELSHSPDSHPVLKGAFAGLRRFRIGDYRVVYVIMEEEVVVLRIGNRKDIYR